jgi:UDP-glucose 4-epimerase
MPDYYDVFNLGTGKGITVLQLVSAFEEASGIKIPYKIVDIRPGDVPLSFAFVDKANKYLNWKTKLDYKECARDAWRWQKNNPNGYQK